MIMLLGLAPRMWFPPLWLLLASVLPLFGASLAAADPLALPSPPAAWPPGSGLPGDPQLSGPPPSGSPRIGSRTATPDPAAAFPRPAALAPQIEFWTRVYSVYTTNQAVIHDSERLDIIYGVVHVPGQGSGASTKLRRRFLHEMRERHAEALRHLAEAPEAAELTALERQVQAAWGAEARPAVFQAAAERVRSQLGQADRFRAGLQRAGAYLPRMSAIMVELGVPEELLALPHVESSFNPAAVSHRGASGIWQWTRPTGRLYLRIDRAIDERRDPLLATRAAGLCLREYYQELGSWPLAITAYNHGLQGMRRARARHGADIAAILRDYDGRAFRFASRNFYTEFLAALDISRDYRKHFGEITPEPALEFDTVRLARPVSLRRAAALAGMRPDEMARLNPALLKPVTSGRQLIPADYELRVRAGRGLEMAQSLGTSPLVIGSAGTAGVAAANSKAGATGSGATGSPTGSGATIHHVQRGDTLSHIARRYGTTVSALRALNRLDSHRIFAGQKLLIPAS